MVVVVVVIAVAVSKVLDGSKRQYIFERRDNNPLMDEGSYMLSHMYDRFLATLHHYHGKNQKKN